MKELNSNEINESMLYFDRIDHKDISMSLLLMEKYREFYINTEIADLQIAIYNDFLGERDKSLEIINNIFHKCYEIEIPEKNKIIKNCELALAYFKGDARKVVKIAESLEADEVLYGEWDWLHPYYVECVIKLKEYWKIINIYENNNNSECVDELNLNYWIAYCYEKTNNLKKAIYLYDNGLDLRITSIPSVKRLFVCEFLSDGIKYAVINFLKRLKIIYEKEIKNFVAK